MRDLIQNPLWQAGDLGQPIPDSPHAVSVALPTWDSVVGYEEERPEIIDRLLAGYPRFFSPPVVQRLFAEACARFGKDGEDALVFPSSKPAERCRDFVEERSNEKVRLEPFGFGELTCVLFPKHLLREARFYWRFSGEIVSSRLAETVLQSSGTPPESARGAEAKMEIRERLASLSGQSVEDVFLFPSGMAAVFTVHRMLTSLFSGRRCAQLDFPYVDVLKVQEEFGSGNVFYSSADSSELDKLSGVLAKEALSGIYCEMPSNPLLRCVDVVRARELADSHRVPLVIDDTVATSVNIDAFRYADIVTTSLTKAFSGTGDVMGGSVILSAKSPHHALVREFLQSEVATEDYLWSGDAIVLAETSRDFPERVARMNTAGEGLFRYLADHPRVAEVYYPINRTPEHFDVVKRSGGGHGGLLSILLRDADTAAPNFYDALRVSKGPSLGTNYTLACPYTLLAHFPELEWAESCGVDRNLVRISVGTEPLDELLARFEEALRI